MQSVSEEGVVGRSQQGATNGYGDGIVGAWPSKRKGSC